MILLRATVEKESLAEELIETLIREKLIFDGTYSLRKVFVQNAKTESIFVKSQFLITARTKALLYQQIEVLLKEVFPKQIESLYAVPIVYMDESQAKIVKEATLPV